MYRGACPASGGARLFRTLKGAATNSDTFFGRILIAVHNLSRKPQGILYRIRSFSSETSSDATFVYRNSHHIGDFPIIQTLDNFFKNSLVKLKLHTPMSEFSALCLIDPHEFASSRIRRFGKCKNPLTTSISSGSSGVMQKEIKVYRREKAEDDLPILSCVS